MIQTDHSGPAVARNAGITFAAAPRAGSHLGYDPVPATVYRCNNPQSYSRTAQASADRLTAKLRTFIHHQQSYSISPSILQSLARTTMSKVVMGCPRAERRRTQALTRPYLSTQERGIFALATEFPWAYRGLNEFRNRQRSPNYRPRQVVAPSDSPNSQPTNP